GGGAVALLGSALGEWSRWHLTAKGAGAIVYLVVFGSILGYSAYTYALRHASPTIVGTYAYVNPVIAVLLGWLILREPVTAQKFALFDDYWSPKIAGELNDSYVKLVKLKGEFVWHHHEREDELFLVVKGRLLLRLRNREVWVNEGEFAIVPKGVEHLPVARDEVHVLLIEPKSTLNTGNVRNERTVEELDTICPPPGRPVVPRRYSGRSGRRVRRLPPADRREGLPRDAREPRRPGVAP